MKRAIILLGGFVLLVVLAVLQGCGSAGMFGSAVICEGVIANIPAQYQAVVDSLKVTLITSDRNYTRRIPLFVDPETGVAPFRLGAAEIKAMFPKAKYSSRDSISISVQKILDGVVRVGLLREPERGAIDSLILNEFNFGVTCDTLVARFDSLGTVNDLTFEKTYVELKTPPHAVELGSPRPGDLALTLSLEYLPVAPFTLPCGYNPFDKYRR
ncbi:MAG: hypothetical protein P1R58_08990 [bacterium]|nr:hypothetical protein [bacterium]